MTTPLVPPFDSTATEFSLNNAYWLARAAEAAYDQKAKLQKAVKGLGLDDFEFLCKKDTEGFVASNDKLIIVAFRGAEPTHLQDLLSDAKIRKVSCPAGKMHRGFLGAYQLVQDDMFKAIEQMRDKTNPQTLCFTGHSLGAVLAAVAVTHALADAQQVSGIYSFGQPRVGDEEYTDAFNQWIGQRYFRFVNNNDTVTRVPPRSLGYSHTGQMRYIDSDGAIHADFSKWEKFLNRVTGRMEDFLKPGTDGLKDHAMPLYRKHIQAGLQPTNQG